MTAPADPQRKDTLMRTLELSLLVDEDTADELLLELADDPRVRQATLSLGNSKYRVPTREAVSPSGRAES